MSAVTARFPAAHQGFVHAIAFDFFGERIATGGADHQVCIYALDGEGQWTLQAEVKAQLGPVVALSWAHPEFGCLLAAASLDHTVTIWDELESVDETSGNVLSRFRRLCELSDSRLGVNDVQFAPRHLGLMLAAACADGQVRIYQVTDVTAATHWELSETFEADARDARSVSWGSSRFDAPMLAVGGRNQYVSIWTKATSGESWSQMAQLKGHSDTVHCVSWAPDCGRGFHSIASASADGTVNVWRVDYPESGPAASTSGVPSTAAAVPWSLEASLQGGGREMWKAHWSGTGSVLAACGDDGVVRLWHRNLSGKWECASQVAVTAPLQLGTALQGGGLGSAGDPPSPHHTGAPGVTAKASSDESRSGTVPSTVV